MANANEVKDRVKERVTEQVETRLTDQKTRAAERVSTVADTLKSSSEDLAGRGEERVSRYVEQAADQVERIASYLQDAEVSEVVHRVERFARREPAAFMAGAFAVGFLASRLLKSSREETGYVSTTDGYRGGLGTYSAGYEASGTAYPSDRGYEGGDVGYSADGAGAYEAGGNFDYQRTSESSRTTSQPESDFETNRGV